MERELSKKIIGETFAKNDIWALLGEEEQTTIVRRVERSCFNSAINTAIVRGIVRVYANIAFINIYSTVCYKIISNIGDDLILKIINGVVDPNNIASMTSYDLNPVASQQIRDYMELRNKQKLDRKVSRLHTCRRCGEKNTVWMPVQTRSGDEDSTIKIKCMTCQFSWQH